jgi:hypothetical protein
VTELRHQKREALAEAFERRAREILDYVEAHLGELLAEASLLDVMRCIGICTDKMILLRGGSPGRICHRRRRQGCTSRVRGECGSP